LLSDYVAFEALLDFSGAGINESIEIPDSLLDAISELAEEPLELEDTPEHVPVLP
jgi:hypothetical protein